jgi:hypothetical protein
VAQVASKEADRRSRSFVGVMAPVALPVESPVEKPEDAALAPALMVAAG